MKLRSNLWSELSRDEIGAAAEAGALAVIPMGSTEQHGPHLPTGTDSILTERIALRAARVSEHPVVVTPTFSMAFSPHHGAWPGTITLSAATMMALLGDITASVARAGFKRQLLVNGHGGNRGVMTVAASEFTCAGREVGWVEYFGPARAEMNAALKGPAKGVTHAAEAETALILALMQDSPELAAHYQARAAALPARRKTTFRSAGDSGRSVIAEAGGWWPSIYGAGDPGYNGEPALATTETGEAMLAVIVPKLAAFYADFARAEMPAGGMPPLD